MPIAINTNIMSLSAQRHLTSHTSALQRTGEKLASGYRINRAADDAAGLQISERLRAQIRGSRKALDNTQDAINFLNVAEGAMAQMGENLQRVRELIIQAQNDTYATAQRNAMAAEITQLFAENDRISESTQYNGIHMLNESFTANFPGPIGFRVQVTPTQPLYLPLPGLTALT